MGLSAWLTRWRRSGSFEWPTTIRAGSRPNRGQQRCTHRTVRGVKHSANRRGKAMHSTEARVGQSHAAVKSAERHVLASIEVITLLKGLFE